MSIKITPPKMFQLLKELDFVFLHSPIPIETFLKNHFLKENLHVTFIHDNTPDYILEFKTDKEETLFKLKYPYVL